MPFAIVWSIFRPGLLSELTLDRSVVVIGLRYPAGKPGVRHNHRSEKYMVYTTPVRRGFL
jgi:hypothetical protein